MAADFSLYILLCVCGSCVRLTSDISIYSTAILIPLEASVVVVVGVGGRQKMMS
jgi:hypothetical protein